MRGVWRGLALLVFVVYPLLELVVAIWIASLIGWTWVILIFCVGFVTGLTLLRRNVASGLLIATPGFVTDAIGLVLLITPIRRAIGSGIMASIAKRLGIPTQMPWQSAPAKDGYLPPDPDHPVVQGEVVEDPDER